MTSQHAKAVLVLAPHPDDETFGCGGTIRLIVESNIPVDVAFMTRGELGHEEGPKISVGKQDELAQLRTQEAAAACRVLGVREHLFLAGSDSILSEQTHLANDILQLLQQRAYRRIFCPWRYDSHADHTATFLLTQLALKQYSADVQTWLYEVWKPLDSNMLVPIDNTVENKREAMLQYRSQLPQVNYHNGFLGLSAYRSVFCPPSRFAEAFYVCDKAEMLRM